MLRFPDIRVRAEAAKLFVAGFDAFPSIGRKYLARSGMARIEADGELTFPAGSIALDDWLATFESVLEDVGPNALFAIGKRIIGNPHFPHATPSLDDALREIDVAYHLSHRKGGVPMLDLATGKMIEGIGHYTVDRVGRDRQIRLTSDTPYPCPMEHGIVAGVALQFEPRALVTHESPEMCRLRKMQRCTYLVVW